MRSASAARSPRRSCAPTSNVDSVDASLQRATDLGGSVVEPKSEVPGQGWYGIFRDPEGNELAVWESLRRS